MFEFGTFRNSILNAIPPTITQSTMVSSSSSPSRLLIADADEQSIYGRNRQSIADIETELYSIFQKRSDSHVNDSGDPVIPASALVEVLDAFTDVYDGVPVLSPEEVTMLQALLDSNPGLEVTPPMLLQFIAQKTKVSPPRSPTDGRSSEEERSGGRGHSKSLSNESNGSAYRQGSHSRPPSRGPMTPSVKSPLDSERRQRSTPLHTAPPSTWGKRPLPAGRRKSDAGSRSDSEVCFIYSQHFVSAFLIFFSPSTEWPFE